MADDVSVGGALEVDVDEVEDRLDLLRDTIADLEKDHKTVELFKIVSKFTFYIIFNLFSLL